MLSTYKALRLDKIPNIVWMKCVEVLIDHLFYIFRVVFELTVCHPRWLESITLVLRKIGKTSYNVAKSYRPIGLIDTIPKVLSTLCSKHISFLVEKHNLLPSSQFGGQPSRNTTDAMLLMVHKIKDTWRWGKVAAALFLEHSQSQSKSSLSTTWKCVEFLNASPTLWHSPSQAEPLCSSSTTLYLVP